MSNPKYLYHYTDSRSIHKIASSGYLQPSQARHGDAALGTGVYFTTKPPQSSNSTLLRNNYNTDAAPRSKVQAYVRVDADKVNYKSGHSRLQRDVYVVPGGNGVNLSKAGATGGFRKRY